MLEDLGNRQQALLRLLLKNKSGMTIDELADSLQITRTAVRQHLWALERNGYVSQGEAQKTKGRPGQTYVLTKKGHEIFPKQYNWFSELILEAIRKERGSEGLKAFLEDLAKHISTSLDTRMEGKDISERANEMAKIMDELAYEAEAVKPKGSDIPAIEATNCVYHHLATKYPEVCQFDIMLLSRAIGAKVNHEECIVRGGNVCRFSFSKLKK